jgi:hypothetical protein
MLRVLVRKKSREMVVEFHVVTDDRADGRGERLRAVTFRQKRDEAELGFGRFHEHEARGRLIGARRPEDREIDDPSQKVVRDGSVLPFGVCAGLQKNLVKAFRDDGAPHALPLIVCPDQGQHNI